MRGGGDGTFLGFLERRLGEMGVRHLGSLKGVAKTAAGKANQVFILEQRAEMRGRLVQAALDNQLKHDAAALRVFQRGGDGNADVIDVDAFDDLIDISDDSDDVIDTARGHDVVDVTGEGVPSIDITGDDV